MAGRGGGDAGFSLTELVVTMAIFSVFSMFMYSIFDTVTGKVAQVGAENSLGEKGQRILSYLEEDIRMTGFLMGPDAQIPYCPGADNGTGTPLPARSPVLSHASAAPYDSLTLLTSIPVELSEAPECRTLFVPGDAGAQKDCASGEPGGASGDRIDYYLTTRCSSLSGGFTVAVDAAAACYQGIVPESSAGKNGRSLVTFDSLTLSGASVAGSFSQLYYSLSSAGSTLTLREALEQDIPDGSTVYGVRMYRYAVVGRALKRIGWDEGCQCGAAVTSDLTGGATASGTSGGVDGLRFEFSSLNHISNTPVTSSMLPPLSELQTITVWLLLRSDRADQGYTDTGTYTLGSAADKLTLGPYRDHYRRLLLRKTVEVKNLGSIR